MERELSIVWRQESSLIDAAYLTTTQGQDLYLGYVATTPGDDVWRGYVGVGFIPVGMGPRDVMRRAVEQVARESLEQSREGRERVSREKHG